MIITAEISLYPLANDYEAPIIQFIKTLKAHEGLEVMTHSMSTYVKGESRNVFAGVDTALTGLGDQTCSMVIKVINRNLPVEDGFLNF